MQLEKLCVRCSRGENCNLKLPLAVLLRTKADKSLELVFGLWCRLPPVSKLRAQGCVLRGHAAFQFSSFKLCSKISFLHGECLGEGAEEMPPPTFITG